MLIIKIPEQHTVAFGGEIQLYSLALAIHLFQSFVASPIFSLPMLGSYVELRCMTSKLMRGCTSLSVHMLSDSMVLLQ